MTSLDNGTLNYLFSLRRLGIKVGLHRTKALLSKCGNPQNNLPVIHVAGTNGKGSTSAMIASILGKSGRKVGLFTSPHLVHYNERIRINSCSVSDNYIVDFPKEQRHNIQMLKATFFETTSALALSYFAHNNVDIAVVEVGMGGRLDSTNTVKSVLTVFTPIDFDHMEFLGYNLESITREKCGILKKGVSTVTSKQSDKVMKIIFEEAEKLDIGIYQSSEISPVKNIQLDVKNTSFEINGQQLTVPLAGHHQTENAQTAITVCQVFESGLKKEIVQKGLSEVKWPGRLQLLSNDPPIYYDTAHNPHGIMAVTSSLKELYPDSTFGGLCAFKSKKQIEEIGSYLQDFFQMIITTTSDHDTFYSSEELSIKLTDSGVNAINGGSIDNSINLLNVKKNKVDTWLIFGTHYISESVFKYFDFSVLP